MASFSDQKIHIDNSAGGLDYLVAAALIVGLVVLFVFYGLPRLV